MTDNNSYIKLFRSLLDWEWWDDLPTRNLWLTILLMANWQDKNWRGMTIKSGQLFTSLEHLSDKSGLSVRQVRTSLNKLKSTNELTLKATKQGTLVTIVNWDVYQGCSEKATHEATNDLTDERQTSDKRATTTKEYKNKKNNNTTTNMRPPTLEEVKAYVEEKGLIIDAEFFWNYYEVSNWKDVKGKAVSNWKLKAITWNNREKKANEQNNADGAGNSQRYSNSRGDGKSQTANGSDGEETWESFIPMAESVGDIW